MKFRITWIDCVGFEIEVEADSPEEALRIFDAGEIDAAPEPDGFCEMETDSVVVTKL